LLPRTLALALCLGMQVPYLLPAQFLEKDLRTDYQQR
jgi:hypothetical protein